MKRKETFISVMIALLFICTGNSHAQTSDGAEEQKSTLIKAGNTAPDFTVEMLDGRTLKLSEMKGKVVLINFWATWCGPCMQEFQVIPEQLIKRFAQEPDFVFLPISREEKKETVAAKMKQLKSKGIAFPVGLDPDRKIYALYAEQFIPRNFVIDKEGKVVFVSIGYNAEEFKKMTDKIATTLHK